MLAAVLARPIMPPRCCITDQLLAPPLPLSRYDRGYDDRYRRY